MMKFLAVLAAALLAIGVNTHAKAEDVNQGFVTVTLLADTSIYADGDVLSDTARLAGACRFANGNVILQSIEVVDQDDQGTAMDVVLLDTSASLGTFNVAPAITDANALFIVGRVNIATGDYIDLGGVRVANKANINMPMKCTGDTSSLFIATITRGGTPTYTAAGLTLRLGFIWD